MGPSLHSHRSSRSAVIRTQHGVVAALILCLTIVAAGCGSKSKQPAASSEEMGGTSQKSTTRSGGSARREAKAAGKAAPKAAEKTSVKPADEPAPKPVAAVSGGGSIRLVDRGCVSFEPHWTTIRVGQSLTWQSELKKSVTIHVPPGAFDRTEYVVPAKKTVHTGPAQEPGDHGMWALPAACQAAPHGVQGAGPGVTIEGR